MPAWVSTPHPYMTNAAPSTICPNCGRNKSGKFCATCGQKEDARYNMHLLWHEAVHAITHADKGIFSYAFQLLYRPGTIALDFVEGRRKRYFNPFQFLLIILGIYIVIVTSTNFMERMAELIADPSNKKLSGEFERVMGFLNRYQKFIYLALIPLSTLVIKWIFPRSGFNYSEHFVGYVVYYSASMLVHGLLMLLTAMVPQSMNLMMGLSTVATLVIMIIYFKQLYKVTWIKAVWKTALYFIFFMGLIMILSMTAGVILTSLSPASTITTP
jgi:hypothetical protein